jgi:hypothetical protein
MSIFRCKKPASAVSLDEGPFRTQSPKPPKPPKPPKSKRPSRTWGEFFLDQNPALITAIIVLGVACFIFGLSWAINACVAHVSPCVGGRERTGTKASTMPDGTPVQVPVQWCEKYKPGREGETP